jgi:hypothetical protein
MHDLKLRAMLIKKSSITAEHRDSSQNRYASVCTRFPHAWVELNGEQKSTLDLFDRSYVLLYGGSSDDNECFHECVRGVNACIAIRISGT